MTLILNEKYLTKLSSIKLKASCFYGQTFKDSKEKVEEKIFQTTVAIITIWSLLVIFLSIYL